MDLAVNYAVATAELVDAGQITLDRFKCPAWPDLIRSIAPGVGPDIGRDIPCYVHFPLLVGTGAGQPIDTETNTAPDFAKIDALLEVTGTPWVSAHLGPRSEDFPGLTEQSWEAQVATIREALIEDLAPLVARYGGDRVVGENIFEYFGMHLRPAVIPEVLSDVIEAAGCGFLLDLSHARLAARDLGVDPRAYVEALPVTHIREIHVTGIQRFGAPWVARLRAAGADPAHIARIEGQWIDHLPMTEADFEVFAWALDRIRAGAWGTPEIIAFEYGGVGPEFEALTIREVLEEQVPRLYRMVHASG
ncbi:MAG: DUF692 family multinuclear iron-containing protein [Anaerolineae bacterium]